MSCISLMAEEIFYWNSFEKDSKVSNCLIRIIFNEDTKKYFIILSQLKSNSGNVGISYGFSKLAESIINKYHFIKDSISNVIWIQHYGSFSEPNSFESMDTKEVFVRVVPNFNELLELDSLSEEMIDSNGLYPLLGEGIGLLKSVDTIVTGVHR